jgi:hypothetical protein
MKPDPNGEYGEVDKGIELVLRLSARLDEILDSCSSEFSLPEDAAKDFLATGITMLTEWYDLSTHFHGSNENLFGLTAKAHLLMHCLLLSR